MRPKRIISTSLLLSSLMFVGAGCGSETPVTPSTATPSTATPTTGTTSSDKCGNPYYPFKQGLTIAYGVTPAVKTAESADYTVRTVSVSGTTAKIRVEMAGGSTVDMEADCANGSVALNGSSGLGAVAEGMQLKTTVLSSSGTYMPADMTAGTVWNNSETIRMDVTGSQAAMGPITMTTKEQSRAIGEEKVTVPAGTYTAIKVEVTRTNTSTAQVAGKSMEIPPSTAKATEWWVKGIGMVKSVTKDQDGTSTVEAKSVSGN